MNLYISDQVSWRCTIRNLQKESNMCVGRCWLSFIKATQCITGELWAAWWRQSTDLRHVGYHDGSKFLPYFSHPLIHKYQNFLSWHIFGGYSNIFSSVILILFWALTVGVIIFCKCFHLNMHYCLFHGLMSWSWILFCRLLWFPVYINGLQTALVPSLLFY